MMRYLKFLENKDLSLNTSMISLGSCTMKLNAASEMIPVSWPQWGGMHPFAPANQAAGYAQMVKALSAYLCQITAFDACSLQPNSGAQGEYAGLLAIRNYHRANNEAHRDVMLIPISAHGTNPASATLGGYEVTTIPTDERGLVDLEALRAALGPDVAGIMLTNPNTAGLFEEDIAEIAAAVHEVGGLLYYDGANLNAILGVVRPGDMGFDIIHMNLHKTFATPHGGGGPGAGPVAVSARVAEFLPGPKPTRLDDGTYGWSTPPQSIGRVHGWHGNALVLARALTYLKVHGADGLRRVAERAVLNANWLRKRIAEHYPAAYDRTCMHEVVVTGSALKRSTGVKAIDVAKRLLEHGFHSPTVYFPLIVDEALMFEPTETESLQTLEAIAQALDEIAIEAHETPERLTEAPTRTPVRRVDEARAARTLIPTEDARQAG